MSKLTIKSPKHCGEKERSLDIEKLYKRLICIGSTLFTTILSIILLVWLILRPTKPQFSLTQADIYQLNLSPYNNLINSSIQLTLLTKNPNQKIGIYYDEIQIYASYKGQQITLYTPMPPFYQGHEDGNLLSASLVGPGLPVAPSIGYEVGRDQTVGRLSMSVRVNGRLRWRVGTWVSGRYRLNVNCVVAMAFAPNNIPTIGPIISTRQASQCSTSV